MEKGDSLWLISKKYKIPVTDLIKINNLNNNIITVGQQLKIPKDTQEKYIVKSGDSLWGISKKYNVSVDDLKKANNLTSNMLSIGKELIIP